MKTAIMKSKIKSFAKLSLIAMLSVAAAFSIYKRIETGKDIASIRSGDNVQIDREIDEYIKQYNSKQAEVVKKYKQEIENSVYRDFAKAKEGAKNFSEELKSVSYLMKISFLSAKDTITSKNSAQDEIQGRISHHITGYLEKDIMETNDLIEECYGELSKNYTQLRLDVDRLFGPNPANAEQKLRIDELGENLMKIQSDLITKANVLGITVAIESIYVKSTYKCLVRLLNPIIKKMVAGIVSSVSDGPLPIGDLVLVGLSIWSVYDIYYIIEVAPEEIQNNLTSELDKQESIFIQDTNRHLMEMLKNFEQ